MNEFGTTTPRTLSANAILAQNLLLARYGADLTQQTLADAADVSRATIAQIEAGIGDPRLSTIEQLARALAAPLTLLLFGPREFHALATVSSAPGPVDLTTALAPSKLRTMNFLIDSGNPRYRLEAARLGIEALREAGMADPPHAVGAAIGSARLPGRGTLLAARLADLLHRTQTKPLPAARLNAADPSLAKEAV